MRARWVAVLVLSAAIAALALPSGASALSRQQANAVALRALDPSAEPGEVVLFGLPSALGARVVVREAGHRGTFLKRPGRKAWLFWEDLEPSAMYQHASIALLVDDTTGRVSLRKTLGYFPLVDGKVPAYLASEQGYYGARYHVFSNLGGPLRPRPSAHGVPSGIRLPSALPAGSLAGDCVLLVALTPQNGKELANAEAALKAWADLGKSLGVPTYLATATGAVDVTTKKKLQPPVFKNQVDAETLAADVDRLVKDKGCKDIVVYIVGHGAPPPGWVDPESGEAVTGSEKPLIFMGQEPVPKGQAAKPNPKVKLLEGAALVKLVHDQAGKAEFKFVLESCFSQRIKEMLFKETNVRIALASSKAEEQSYFNLNHDPPKDADGKEIKSAVANPGLPEFTHGVVEGVKSTVASDDEITALSSQGGSLLARILKAAFDKEQGNDRAAASGRTNPVVNERLNAKQNASCTGTFLPFDMTEVAFRVSCSQLGGTRSIREPAAGQPTRFDITLPGTRKVTNLLSPSGFACTIATRTTTSDTLSCAGTIVASAVYQGNIRMTPGPSTGMGGTLYLFEGNTQIASFPITGP